MSAEHKYNGRAAHLGVQAAVWQHVVVCEQLLHCVRGLLQLGQGICARSAVTFLLHTKLQSVRHRPTCLGPLRLCSRWAQPATLAGYASQPELQGTPGAAGGQAQRRGEAGWSHPGRLLSQCKCFWCAVLSREGPRSQSVLSRNLRPGGSHCRLAPDLAGPTDRRGHSAESPAAMPDKKSRSRDLVRPQPLMMGFCTCTGLWQ